MKLISFGFIGGLVLIITLILFKHKTQAQRHLFLVFLSLIAVIYYIHHWFTVIYIPRDLLIILPLQLCDLAVFLMPIGLISKKEKIMDFLFYACGLGALAAIILMGTETEDPFYVMDPNFFYSHFTILSIPALCVVWGLYDPKPTLKKALWLTAELMILAAFMHGLNLYFAHFYQAYSYYFFTIIETGVQISPLLELFAKIIPYDYFYLIPTLPIMFGYMGLVYLARQQILKHPS